MNTFDTFLQLHQHKNPLLLGNVWDVTSAAIFERQGFPAIGTSSRAIAHALGYEDGENIPFDLLLQIVERIISRTTIPLTVDLEAGYSRETSGIIKNIEELHALGVAGINLEDSVRGSPSMKSANEFSTILFAIANHFSRRNMRMFINARTDSYLLRLPNALKETMDRVKMYEDAGASGIFVPFICTKNDITAVAQATKLPLNVLCTVTLPSFKELCSLGVKRISMGDTVHQAMSTVFEKTVQKIVSDQSFESLFHSVQQSQSGACSENNSIGLN